MLKFVLNLNNNKIKTIPKQISNLKKLRILQLSNNKITSLPKTFNELESLQKLNISKNLFVDFPNEILRLSRMKNLWLNYLQLKSFPISQITNELTNLSGIYCYGKIVNTNNINKDYVHLSKIKGNSLAEFILLTNSVKINSEKPKISLNKKISNLNVQKNRIFISYSHTDKDWLKKVQTNLKVLTFNDFEFDLWDDTRIESGDKWKTEIENALEKAGIAILIISTEFLISDFVRSNELPTILRNAKENGTVILPLIVKHCRFTKDKYLSIFQSVNDPNKPLNSLKEFEVEKELVKLTEDVEKILLG